jgi:hypothetical protein
MAIVTKVSDELVVATRAAHELEPAVREFAAAVGRSGPVHELLAWISEEIRYRREPRKAQLLLKAAEKIRASGAPARAVDDRLLRAVLEEGSFEDDDAMQDRWARLLANAVIGSRAPHVAFPGILAQLEPAEARMLDAMHRALDDEIQARANSNHALDGFDPSFFLEHAGVDRWAYPTASGNLVRLRLAETIGRNEHPPVVHSATHRALSVAIQLTYLGAEFVVACLPADTPSAVTMLQLLVREPDR